MLGSHIASGLCQPDCLFLLLHHFAETTLGAFADFDSVGFQVAIFGHFRVRALCLCEIEDLAHLVETSCLAECVAGRVVSRQFSFHARFVAPDRQPTVGRLPRKRELCVHGGITAVERYTGAAIAALTLPCQMGPGVRIHFPPAASLVRT
jgi:hypothetical protein